MKFFGLFLFQIMMINLLFCQESEEKVHFGLSVAPQINISDFKSDPVFNNRPSLAMAMGGDLYLDISNFAQFRTGLNFHSVTLKHRDYSPQFPGDVINGQFVPHKSYWDFNTAYTFIGLPIVFKIKAVDQPNHIFFSGGLEIEQKLYSSGSIEATESGVQSEVYKPDNFLFRVTPTQLFSIAGFGFEWTQRKSKISLGPVLEYSLTKYFKLQSSALKNSHLMLFGFRFAYN